MGRPSKAEQQAQAAASDAPARKFVSAVGEEPEDPAVAALAVYGIDRLLSAAEVGAWIGKPVATLYQWSSRGTGGPPVIKVGGDLRYRRSHVEGWLDTQTRPASAA